MMTKIYRVALRRTKEFIIEIPAQGTYRGIAPDEHGFPHVLVEAAAGSVMEKRTFRAFGAGEKMEWPENRDKRLVFIGSYQSHLGKYTWLVYEEVDY